MPTVKRFHSPDGDASVLPFGITCINVTDMMAKFLMLAKSTDKMEALMSQKPFWRMFADPNAILALQELSMQMLCNVVVEMNRERCIPSNTKTTLLTASNLPNLPHAMMMPGGNEMNSNNNNNNRPVSVFDFSEVLERTERRVRDDLLGAGPSTVEELRSIAATLATKYQHQLEQKERKGGVGGGISNSTSRNNNPVHNAVAGASNMAGSAVAGASNMASGMFEKIKSATPMFSSNPLSRNNNQEQSQEVTTPTIVDIPPETSSSQPAMVDLLNTTDHADDAPTIGDDWMGVSKEDLVSFPPAASNTTTSSPPFHFSIDDDEDI